jgi:hypothetical protein
MSTWSVSVSGDEQLEAAFAEAPEKLIDGLHKATKDAGTDMRNTWRANAKRTAGKHGKWYPGDIQANTDSGVDWVESTIEPSRARRQGAMSFEYGSRHQPPHLDGAKAMLVVTPVWNRACDEALDRALEAE